MKRILLMVFRNIFRVVPMWIKLCYMAAHPDKYTDEQHNKMFKYIVTRANIGGNVKIKAFGVENLPKENGFMFFPNHQGMYDVLAIIDCCPIPFSTTYKIELKDVPFIKQIASCMKAFYIDRDDVRQSMKTIIAIAQEVEKGRNYLIFPEGTRSKDGNNVGEFKGEILKIDGVKNIEDFHIWSLDGIDSVMTLKVNVDFGTPVARDYVSDRDPYTGSYTVIPSQTEQVLLTNNLRMTDNITVEAIPSCYGLITWNGSTLLVS